MRGERRVADVVPTRFKAARWRFVLSNADTGRVRRVLLAVLCLALPAAACSGSKSDSAATSPASCDLSGITPQVSDGPAESTAPALASMTAFSVETNENILIVSVQPNGEITALGTGDQPHHGRLTASELAQVQQCIDDSGFLSLDEGFTGAATGSAGGDSRCTVSDASVITVTAKGSSGEVRTASGIGPGFADSGCDFGYPDALVDLHAALERIRATTSAL